MCVVLRAVRLYPALLNDQLLCVLSQPGELWQHQLWALMPKSDLSWWMGSLSPSNYRWIFRCIHYLLWTGFCLFMWESVGESGGYCYTSWTAGGQLMCWGCPGVFVSARLLSICNIHECCGDQCAVQRSDRLSLSNCLLHFIKHYDKR